MYSPLLCVAAPHRAGHVVGLCCALALSLGSHKLSLPIVQEDLVVLKRHLLLRCVEKQQQRHQEELG
jgi:hypothetical protein